jgi:M6 family metalloprotease-like protein
LGFAIVGVVAAMLLIARWVPAQVQEKTQGSIQTPAGILSGTVYGLGGSGLRAVVTVSNPVSGFRERTQSDPSGRFTFPQLPPGVYDLEAWAPKFAAHQLNAIRVDANERWTVNVVLQRPSFAASNVPVEAEVSGTLTAIVTDDFEGRSSTNYMLTLPAKPGDEPETIEVWGNADEAGSATGRRVTLRGFRYGDLLADAQMAIGDSRSVSEKSDGVRAALVSGNRTVIALNLRTSSGSTVVPNATLTQTFFTATDSVASYYQEASYGLMTLSGTVSGPYVVGPIKKAVCDYVKWGDQANVAAAAAGVDLSAYQHIVYVLPPESLSRCENWKGKADIGGARSWLVGELATVNSEHVIAHEVAHNLGLLHSNTPTDEYGDDSDTMGTTGYDVNPHFNAPHKAQLGWLSAPKLAPVSASGTYSVSALVPASGVTAYTLEVPGSTDLYYVSYRTAVGVFDSLLDSRYVDRTSIHRFDGTGPTILLASLADGQFFYDSGTLFTQASHDAGSASVTIELGAAEPPPPPPTPDTEPPSPPSILYLSLKGQKVNLSWPPGTDNVGVAGYNIFRNDVHIATTSATNYSDSGTVSGGGTYVYKVYAFDAAGNISTSFAMNSVLR